MCMGVRICISCKSAHAHLILDCARASHFEKYKKKIFLDENTRVHQLLTVTRFPQATY